MIHPLLRCFSFLVILLILSCCMFVLLLSMSTSVVPSGQLIHIFDSSPDLLWASNKFQTQGELFFPSSFFFLFIINSFLIYLTVLISRWGGPFPKSTSSFFWYPDHHLLSPVFLGKIVFPIHSTITFAHRHCGKTPFYPGEGRSLI